MIHKQSKEKQNASNIHLKVGEVFGQIEFFTGTKSLICIRSREFTKILKISRQVMIDLLKGKEKDYELFCQIKDQIMMYSNFNDIEVGCKICKKQSHQITQCSQLHFDKDIILTKIGFTKSKDQIRQQFQRREEKFRALKQQDQFQIIDDLSHLINYIQSQSTLQKTINPDYFENDFSENDENEDSQDDSRFIKESSYDRNEENQKYNSVSKTQKTHIQQESTSAQNINSQNQITKIDKKNNTKSSVMFNDEIEELDSNHSKESEKRNVLQENLHLNMQKTNSREFQQDNLIRKAGSEVDFGSPNIFKSQKFVNGYKQPSIFNFQENDDSKQKSPCDKRRNGFMDYTKMQTQMRRATIYQQPLRIQHNAREALEQFQQINNPWLFESLKDYNYYFKNGNSRQSILKHNKYTFKKNKQHLKRQSKKL